MIKNEAILHYKTAMSVFKHWHKNGIVNDADLLALSTRLGEKYGLSSCSIYLENDLKYTKNRVNIGSKPKEKLEDYCL